MDVYAAEILPRSIDALANEKVKADNSIYSAKYINCRSQLRQLLM